jgi:hypothetical protein
MKEVATFDEFLLSLCEKISRNPEHKSAIIHEEMLKTACPYLRDKLKRIDDSQPNMQRSPTG